VLLTCAFSLTETNVVYNLNIKNCYCVFDLACISKV
jgi:hypothetical protein